MNKQFQVLTLIPVLGFSGATSAATIPGFFTGVLDDGTLTSGGSGDLHGRLASSVDSNFPGSNAIGI